MCLGLFIESLDSKILVDHNCHQSVTFDNSLDNNQRDISLSIILDKEQHFLQDFSHHFTKAPPDYKQRSLFL